jgi:ribonuclease BN (tRNA processing enzyme)
VFGPGGNASFPSTTEFVRTLFAEPGGAYRYLSDFVTADAGDAYRLEPHDVEPSGDSPLRVFEAGGLVVSAARVTHGGVPALAYRVDLGNVSVAFSGDTNGEGSALATLAAGATVLVAHNAVPEGAQGIERALHMPPSVIGRIAQDARVARLVLSHRMLRTLGREATTLRIIAERYRGPARFADDLDCIPLRARAAATTVPANHRHVSAF